MGTATSAPCTELAVMPDDLSPLLLAYEFTVLRPRPGVQADAYYIWSVFDGRPE